MKGCKIIYSLFMLIVLLSITVFPGCGGGGGGGGNVEISPEATATIGPSGGVIEVDNPSSALYGAKIEIPEGALEQETDIKVYVSGPGEIPAGIRFFGGIKIDGGEATLMKNINISIPNSFNATNDDQLLVGQLRDSKTIYIYRGIASVGSPIVFNASDFGSFAVLSPVAPLGVVSGTFVNQSDNPISDGIIAASFSNPFVAQTNNAGYFEIPAGPAGSYSAVMGIPLSGFTDPSGIGIETVQVPTSLTDVITDITIKIITDQLNVPEPPISLCICDPCPPNPPILSKEDSEPPFELSEGQTIQTYLSGFEPLPPMATLPLDILMGLWSDSMCIPLEIRFWTEDNDVASVNDTGQLTGKSKGETWEHAEVKLFCLKICPGPNGTKIVMPCPPCFLQAIPVKIIVECQNIAGIWKAEYSDLTDQEVTLTTTFYLSQSDCNVTGVEKIPPWGFDPMCPSCFSTEETEIITGKVNGNNFFVTIAGDYWVECPTCEVICYDEDIPVALVINGDRMHGEYEEIDCMTGEVLQNAVNLVRISQ